MRAYQSLRLAALSVLLPLATLAGEEWVPLAGPDGGTITILRATASADYAGTRGGAYRSIDGGQQWSEITATLEGAPEVTALGVSGDTVLLATADALLRRSGDGGATWEELPHPSPGFVFRQFAVYGARIYAVIADTPVSGGLLGSLWVSDDLGTSWMEISNVGFPLHEVFVDDDVLLVSANDPSFGFFPILRRSVDDGATWTTVGQAPGSTLAPFSFFAFTDVVRVNGELFLNAEGEAIYRSTDNGLNWSRAGYPANGGLQNVQLAASDGTLYFSGFRRDDGTTEVGPGIWKSANQGATWTRADNGLSEPFNLMSDLTANGPDLLVGGITGLFRSDDGGDSWSRGERGLSAAHVYGFTAGPTRVFANVVNTTEVWRFAGGGWTDQPSGFGGVVLGLGALDDETLFVGSQTEGIRRSTDGGQTFQSVNTGVPQYNGTAGNQYREVEAFAFTGTTIFAGIERGLQQIPGSQGFQISGAGVLRSTNGGTSWTLHNSGLPVTGSDNFGRPLYPPILSLTADESVVLAGTYLRGIFRSTSNGLTWSAANAGLPHLGTTTYPLVLALTRFDGAYYAALSNGFGVYTSADGSSWTACAAGLPSDADAATLTVFEDELYVGHTRVAPDVPSVYRLDASACQWTPVGTVLDGVEVRHLAANAGGLFAATTTRSAWRLASGAACPGDVDGDEVIGLEDLSALLGTFGRCAGEAGFDARADFDGSGCVDLVDLTTLLGAYGTSCS